MRLLLSRAVGTDKAPEPASPPTEHPPSPGASCSSSGGRLLYGLEGGRGGDVIILAMG